MMMMFKVVCCKFHPILQFGFWGRGNAGICSAPGFEPKSAPAKDLSRAYMPDWAFSYEEIVRATVDLLRDLFKEENLLLSQNSKIKIQFQTLIQTTTSHNKQAIVLKNL